jgi:hypothetical protein
MVQEKINKKMLSKTGKVMEACFNLLNVAWKTRMGNSSLMVLVVSHETKQGLVQ